MTKNRWMIAVALLGVGACADRAGRAGEGTGDSAMVDEVQDGMNRVDESLDGDGGMSETEDLLDANLASADELRVVGLTDAAVAAIVGGRPFENMVQVDGVLAGVLDAAAREDVYRSIWIPLDLNSASREEILLIPGVGDRMAHEFEEYQPYTAMAQFRREIGKYVDEQEVERLARYVRIE